MTDEKVIDEMQCALLRGGYGLFRDGAIRGFREFCERFPTDRQSTSAQKWLHLWLASAEGGHADPTGVLDANFKGTYDHVAGE